MYGLLNVDRCIWRGKGLGGAWDGGEEAEGTGGGGA